MPSTHSPTPIDRTAGSDVTALVDGDALNRDALYVEATPGATPKLTLGYLLSCIDGVIFGTATQVEAYTGVSFTIAAGALKTYLRLLADKAPRLDKGSNDFAGRIGVGTDVDVGQDLTVAGSASIASLFATFCQFAGAIFSGTFEKTNATIGTTATTYNYQTVGGAPIVVADGWHNGHLLTVTLANPTGGASSRRYEVEFWWNPTNAGGNDTILFNNASAVGIAYIITAGYARFRWNGTSWKCMFAMPFDGNFVSHVQINP